MCRRRLGLDIRNSGFYEAVTVGLGNDSLRLQTNEPIIPAAPVGKRRIRWRYTTLGSGGTAPPPQIVARHPNLAVLLAHCGRLILIKKINKLDVTRCPILRLKCTKFNFRWGSPPRPDWGSLQRSPDPLAVFMAFYGACF